MSKKSLLIAAGLACFLAFSVALAPAQVLTDLFPAQHLRFVGVTGTIWRGGARAIQTSVFQFNLTTWALRPVDLLFGRLGATIETEWSGGFAGGDLSVGFDGALRLHDFEAMSPIAPIVERTKLPPASGYLVVKATQLDIKDGWPKSVVGAIRVSNVPLTVIGVPRGPTGSYEVSFDIDAVDEDGRFSGNVVDLDGPLAISGTLVLNPPNNYEFNAKLKARLGAPNELVRGLNLLGPADADGNREFRMSGSL